MLKSFVNIVKIYMFLCVCVLWYFKICCNQKLKHTDENNNSCCISYVPKQSFRTIGVLSDVFIGDAKKKTGDEAFAQV